MLQVPTARGVDASQRTNKCPVAGVLLGIAAAMQTDARATAIVAQQAGSPLLLGHMAEPGVLEAGIALQHLDGAGGVRVTASCEAYAAERTPAAGLMAVSANLPAFARRFSRARRCAAKLLVTSSYGVVQLKATLSKCCMCVLRRSAKRHGARRMCYGDSAGKRCIDMTGHSARLVQAYENAAAAAQSYTTAWQRTPFNTSKPRYAMPA